MAYLGEEPKFGSFASETFSGNGSATSFTLTHGAASPSSLLVTIDGVKQQTTAYTITDTALDFGAGNAPAAGTNNIEVVYLGTKSLVGAVADGAITTSKIANNAVTGAKIAMGSDAAGDILTYTGTDYVRLAKGTASQTLKMNSGASAVEWATVAAAGDNTPSFFVTGSGNQAIAHETWTKVAWSTTSATERWDTDSAFASDKFTVPSGEAGKYLFSFGGLMDEMDTNESWNMDLYVNGSEHTGGNSLGRVHVRSFNTNLGTFGNSTIAINLSVGDYVEIYFYHNEGSTNNLQLNRSFFQGFKLAGV